MKCVFISNYFNHHQEALSDALNELCDYHFVSTGEMPLFRKELGYNANIKKDYLMAITGDSNADVEVQKLIDNADVVIIGSASQKIIKSRIEENKLIFRCSERLLKKGFELAKYFLRYCRYHISNPKGKSIYLLCASAYCASDYAKFGLFKKLNYKWGYYPQHISYDIESLLTKKNISEILWCGRLIDWKHPDDALKVAKKLKKNGYAFHMKIIGTGEMDSTLQRYCVDNKISDCVTFLGSVPQSEVRQHMESAGIFIFTSDRNEGWGAVLNEAMNSGCAVVASNEIGSVPYLMKHMKNGAMYRSGDVNGLYDNVEYLLSNPEKQKMMGEAAYATIAMEWNANVAAARFINLASHILAGEKYPDLYKTGPCSKAENIKDGWYKTK